MYTTVPYLKISKRWSIPTFKSVPSKKLLKSAVSIRHVHQSKALFAEPIKSKVENIVCKLFVKMSTSTNAEQNEIDPETTIFAKIVKKEIPIDVIYEDNICMAFHDINPVANVHALVIPKKPFPIVSDDFNDAEVLGHCLIAARKVAETVGIGDTGYRLVINNGKDALQSIRWLHIHVIGGQELPWPP